MITKGLQTGLAAGATAIRQPGLIPLAGIYDWKRSGDIGTDQLYATQGKGLNYGTSHKGTGILDF